MSKPILLWHPRRSVALDEVGTTVVKFSYKNSATPAPYEAFTPRAANPSVYVPSLQSLCIVILSKYPDQLYAAGSTRLVYHPPQAEGGYNLLHELIPAYSCDPPLPEDELFRCVDPRLWATLIQLYEELPPYYRKYKLPLADLHMPLLQAIPSTQHFALVTVVELPACRDLTDDTIVHFGQLHSLVALDASATSLTSWGVKTLAKTLMKRPDSTVLSGPWGLRILYLRDCVFIDKEVHDNLLLFPLLSIIDLTGTKYTHHLDNNTPFRLENNPAFFQPTSLVNALDALNEVSRMDQGASIYAHERPFVLHVDSLEHKKASARRYANMLKSTPGSINRPLEQRANPSSNECDQIAVHEGRREASRSAASAFYTAKATPSPPLTFGKFGEIYNPPTFYSSAKRARPSRINGQNLQRLSREPPPWSLLEDIRLEASGPSREQKPKSRAGTDERPLSSRALVASRRATESVGAVCDMLKGRFGESRVSTEKDNQLHKPRGAVLNPFSRQAFEEAFNIGKSGTEELAGPSPVPRKKRRVSSEDDFAQDQAEAEPVVPKSILPIPPRSSKPANRPLTSLPIPILPPELILASEEPKKAKVRSSSAGAGRPRDTVQTRLSAYLKDEAASGRGSRSGFRAGMRGSARDVAPVKIGEPSGSRAQGSSSAVKGGRKSTDSVSSFDWKRWGDT